MKFEGRPLSARARLVNAMLAIGLLLGVSTCSGGESREAPAAENTVASPTQIVELSAVWATSPLDKPAADIALAGGLSPVLAVAYEGAGLQLFDLEGERITEIAPYKVKQLAGGHEIEIDGARLTVFPGLNEKNELHAYVYADGLVAPVEVLIGAEPARDVAGICSQVAKGDDGRLLTIGYWKTRSKDLVTFPVTSVNGEFDWIEDPTLFEQSETIQACEFYNGSALPFTGTTIDGAILTREGYTGLVTLQQSGALQARTGTWEEVSQDGGKLVRLLVNNGLSVSMPEAPTAIAALGKPLAGGYGGGLIVVTGEVDGEDKAVFIAADGLTGLSSNAADRTD